MLSNTSSINEEIDTTAAGGTPLPNKLALMGDDMLLLVLSSWLDFFDFGVLDIAMSNREYRQRWLELLSRLNSKVFEKTLHCDFSLRWLIRRRIATSNVEFWDDRDRITDNTFDAIQIPALLSIKIVDCVNISNTAICLIAEGCPFLQDIVLEGCNQIDDIPSLQRN